VVDIRDLVAQFDHSLSIRSCAASRYTPEAKNDVGHGW
jgi:hypothetical protein